jgi:hypothetical protein
MGIDGIGKPGPVAPPPAEGALPSAAPDKIDERLEVRESEAPARAAGSEALQALERGELSLDSYLEVRVDHAVEHLQGRLPAAELEFVKELLREQLRTDPVLVELVRRATGMTPAAR